MIMMQAYKAAVDLWVQLAVYALVLSVLARDTRNVIHVAAHCGASMRSAQTAYVKIRLADIQGPIYGGVRQLCNNLKG